jgi:superfamily I DNA/RNA helicase
VVDDEILAQMERDRAAAVDKIVSSDHRLRVIVAGPGTGKTSVFADALDRAGGKGLALTFIRKLAGELEERLREKAETNTFHKFAKMLVYRLGVPGLTVDFSLYPPLTDLTDIDIGLLAPPRPEERQVERLMQDLADSRLTGEVLRLGTYYDAASFVDVVYRVFTYLQDNPERTPKYPLVVVDEYQDFTRLETAFIAQLGFASPLLIAGDDDQALYDRRFASEEHIRTIATSTEAEPHELPFCSRCTVPVVDAVNAVITRARDSRKLVGRLDKPFRCYLPDKLAASERHPQLIDARCSTLGITGRYIENEIGKILPEDVQSSSDGHYPTVLVVGPGHFVRPVYEHLKEGRYPQAEYRRTEPPAVEFIHGYRRIARDPRSNLGWRILVHLLPFTGWQEAIRESIGSGEPLVERLPDEYRHAGLEIADLVARGLTGEDWTAEERARAVVALGVTEQTLDDVIGRPEEPIDTGSDDATAAPPPVDEPRPPELTILCTSLQGAKGLSAEHVFVVGLVGGHFPQDNADPTDKEICEFLVALSRTRTKCQLVSTHQLGGPPPGRRAPQQLPVSVFVEWVASQCAALIEVRAADLPRPR